MLPSHTTTERHLPPASLLEAITAALDADDAASALRLCEKRLTAVPHDADAYRYLGQIQAREGNLAAARDAGRRATELAPDDPRAWSDLGRVLVLLRDWPGAVRCFRQAVSLQEDYADGWHNLGTALKKLGHHERAFECLKRALVLDPTRPDTYMALGRVMVEAGQLDDAIGCFQRAATYDDGSHGARNCFASELSECGQLGSAQALFNASLQRNPDDVAAWVGLGRTLEDLGHGEIATTCYRNALKRQPGHGVALGHYLSLVKDEPEAASWVAHAHRALARDDVRDEAKALVGYGLAKYYDRRRQYAEAAQAGTRANAARRRKAGPLDRATLEARVNGIIETYTRDFFYERRQFGIGTDQPVFIVGLPRSGTTLTEQILAAHPAMYGAGELRDLARLAQQMLSEKGDKPWQAALRLTEMTSRDYAYEYVRALQALATPDHLRISDKQPLNFFQLAFAALLFPNARVIYCRRDARDNGLSIWMENFNPDQRYATDFDDLAFFTAQERRVMAHWKAALPLDILDMPYEDTVADLEGQARRLIAFLGTEWDDNCLNFHEQDRAVQTPSRWQVRQPIYTGSVGRWKQYREYLPELDTAFTELLRFHE